MTTPKDDIQDDYYANISQVESTTGNKKILKIKPKVVAKKPTEPTSEIVEETVSRPKIIARKIEKSETVEVADILPISSETERPTARLVSREHAGEGLMRSVMKQQSANAPLAREQDTTKKPLISFQKSSIGFRPLENRPVMQLPPEDRRGPRPPRPAGSSPRPFPSPSGTTAPAPTGPARLRDSSKPMFQRDISFSTPTRDGTAKKGGKGGARDYDANKKKSLKSVGGDADDGSFRRGHKQSKKQQKALEDVKQILVDRTGQEVSVGDMISVKEFSDKLGVSVVKVIGELMKNGVLVTLNAPIDFDTCFLIGEAFQIKVTKEISEDVSVSDLMDGNIADLIHEDDMAHWITRSPIISVMGHVDHGKTSILDFIRKSTIASGEAGGITQKIGAYQVTKNDKRITFLDTPGHEAFTIMRARGAKLTDIAVIVIAADEGMKPQSIESINHAKEAGVPIIVALNKMDKPGANIDMIKGQLSEQGLQSEDWGGTTVVVPVSAHTGFGMDTLLEMILLQAEMLELRANPDRGAVATVIEAHMDAKLGSVATILINTGTIHKTDNIVCAGVSGRVRTLKDYKARNIESAGPGTPVQITGLSGVVEGGDILQVVSSPEIATTRAKEYSIAKNKKSIHAFEGASLAMLMGRLKSGALKQLKVVLKTDTGGSLEALKASLAKLSTPETQVTFIHAALGDVNQSDIMMAGTSQALLIAYNVGILPAAKSALSQSKIEFIDKKVIYHVLEKVESIITGMIDIRYEEAELGSATAKAIFYTGKNKSMMIVGLGVDTGRIEPRSKVRVIRAGHKVGSGEVANLKKGPLDVIEAEEGDECGINFKGDVTIEIGDKLEFYKMVQRK
ncbi:translation initiation factor IF-2 [Candidatus Gracilibacteria bacterium]|nr:translation initiation factor IF-2 [Candidatus Gracilibacteria bacterium]